MMAVTAPARRIAFSGIRSFHRLFLRRELPARIALYGHSLEPADYEALRQLVDHFTAAGYRFTTPDEFLGEGNERRVFLSFDDNYRSWYTALPLLATLSVSVTFYVNSGPLRDRAGKDDVKAYFERIRHPGEHVSLSTAELRAIAAAGYAIGSHTEWHEPLTRLPAVKAEASIARGKQQLEDVLGREVTHFSFPFGMRRYFNEALADYCFRIGIRTIAAATPALQYAEKSARRIHRSGWHFDRELSYNLDNVRIDGRRFEALTGRSAVG